MLPSSCLRSSSAMAASFAFRWISSSFFFPYTLWWIYKGYIAKFKKHERCTSDHFWTCAQGSNIWLGSSSRIYPSANGQTSELFPTVGLPPQSNPDHKSKPGHNVAIHLGSFACFKRTCTYKQISSNHWLPEVDPQAPHTFISSDHSIKQRLLIHPTINSHHQSFITSNVRIIRISLYIYIHITFNQHEETTPAIPINPSTHQPSTHEPHQETHLFPPGLFGQPTLMVGALRPAKMGGLRPLLCGFLLPRGDPGGHNGPPFRVPGRKLQTVNGRNPAGGNYWVTIG